MKGFIAVTALATLMLTSCSATWTIRWTMPTQDNTGTCTAPIIVPTSGGLVRARITWSGASSGQDSVIAAPGVACSMSHTGPVGIYQFIAFAADSVGNVSCNGDTLVLFVRGRFNQITDLRAQ